MKTLTREQLIRYNRHIVLPAIDLKGQEQLLDSHVLVIGAGGLGCAALPYLVSSGVGKITVIDADIIEASNLQRQPLFTEQDIGNKKAEVAVKRLKQLNSECQLTALNQWADEAVLGKHVDACDLVVDCCDNLATRNLINQQCLATATPLVSGSAIRFEGQVAAFKMDGKSPCYQCLSSLFGEQSLSCAESGVAAPLVGVVGSMQALEVIKILSGAGAPLYGQLLMFDGLSADWQRFKIARHPHCPACSAIHP